MTTGPIIVATDLSDKSYAAMRAAAVIAKARGARLHCVNVIEELDEGSAWLVLVEDHETLEKNMRAERQQTLDALITRELDGLIDVTSVKGQVCVGNPSDEILALGDELDASMIVTGSLAHGPLEAIFLGSTANALLRRGERPTLIVPPGADAKRFRKILAPVDDSAASRASLRHAVEMARAIPGGQLVLMHSVATPAGIGDAAFPVHIGAEALGRLVQSYRRWLESVAEELEITDIVSEYILEQGTPAPEIIEVGKREDVDLICMGSNGRQGLRRFLLGGTAERVLRDAPCPVLAIYEEDPEPFTSPEEFWKAERDAKDAEA